ncbi:hypothetical protein [Solibacillus isronensis]|uniref:hypothetical protein n=1 Tax=Solibacillus isronensis TaxID=412383 RepID=UPI0039A1FC37
MLKDLIQEKVSSMLKRKVLFIIGDYQKGKTTGVIEYLKDKYGEMWENHYIDVGLFLQKSISEEQITLYKIFNQEFENDSVKVVNNLINNNIEKFLVIDHCEWLFAEKQTEWLKTIFNEAEEKRVVLMVVPNEYKMYVPTNAFSVIEWKGDNHED